MTKKTKRRLQKAFRVVFGIGFLLLIGTVGAYEIGSISTVQFVIQTVAGLSAFAGGGYLGGLMA